VSAGFVLLACLPLWCLNAVLTKPFHLLLFSSGPKSSSARCGQSWERPSSSGQRLGKGFPALPDPELLWSGDGRRGLAAPPAAVCGAISCPAGQQVAKGAAARQVLKIGSRFPRLPLKRGYGLTLFYSWLPTQWDKGGGLHRLPSDGPWSRSSRDGKSALTGALRGTRPPGRRRDSPRQPWGWQQPASPQPEATPAPEAPGLTALPRAKPGQKHGANALMAWRRQRRPDSAAWRRPYLHNVLVYALRVSVHQVDLLDVLVLDDDPLLQLGLFLRHGGSGGSRGRELGLCWARTGEGRGWVRRQGPPLPPQLPGAPGSAPG